jgi:hypothetical protein
VPVTLIVAIYFEDFLISAKLQQYPEPHNDFQKQLLLLGRLTQRFRRLHTSAQRLGEVAADTNGSVTFSNLLDFQNTLFYFLLS